MGFPAVPASTGPLARLAELAINAPATAPAGELVRVSVTIRISSNGARMITRRENSALLVVSGDQVVAGGGDPARTGAVPLILRAGATAPAQAVPDAVRLCAVDGGPPLPAGRYALVAVLGYQNDSLNSRADGGLVPPTGARGFVLVSAPVPLEVQ